VLSRSCEPARDRSGADVECSSQSCAREPFTEQCGELVERAARVLEPVVRSPATIAKRAAAGATEESEPRTVAALHVAVADDAFRACAGMRRAVREGAATPRRGGSVVHAPESAAKPGRRVAALVCAETRPNPSARGGLRARLPQFAGHRPGRESWVSCALAGPKSDHRTVCHCPPRFVGVSLRSQGSIASLRPSRPVRSVCKSAVFLLAGEANLGAAARA
jgi:hypothetical protein